MAPTILTTVKVPAAAQFQGGAPFDLVSLADVKTELQIKDGSNDAWLAQIISRVSRGISQFCNRTFQIQTYQDQFWPQRDPYPWQLPGGVMPLQLSQWPVAAQVSPAGCAPPAAPLLSAVSGGALPAATYYVKATYVTAAGETAASLELSRSVTSNSLLQIASPPLDNSGLATGWNAYIGKTSFSETLQTAVPLPIGIAFTLPSWGLIAGSPLPPYVAAFKNAVIPTPLAEGVDFIVDADNGQLSGLFPDGYICLWNALPIIVQYRAGYSPIPFDIQEAVIRLVKSRWFARNRDPMLRSENVEGIYEAQYFFGTGPGSPADMPADIGAMLERNYRIPVIA